MPAENHLPRFEIVPREQLHSGKNVRESIEKESLEELIASIRTNGVLVPIRVQPLSGSRDPPQFEVIDGHRRLMACERIPVQSLPCLVVGGTQDEVSRTTEQLVLNCIREGLRVGEVAKALKILKEARGLTGAKVGQLVGFTPEKVSRYMALGDLPADLMALVESGQIKMTTALELGRLDGPVREVKVAEAIRGKVTRDQLAGARKQREKSAKGSNGTQNRATACLAGGKTVTVVAQGLTLDSFITALEELLSLARKERAKGITLSTFTTILRDQALKSTLAMEA